MRYQLIGMILFITAAAPVAHAQQAIFLIRHAEQMHDMENPPLTEAGFDRAKTWARVFRDAGIKMIYTSKKTRTKQTGETIATELDIPLSQISRKDIDGLVKQVRNEHADEVVLIVTHSKTLPRILQAFAPFGEYPGIKKDDYGNLFIVVTTAEADPMVIRLRH